MDHVGFTRNWNGKLENEYFTTIRIKNPKKFYPGATLEIKLHQKHFCYAEVVKTAECLLEKLTDWICFLDTGYDAVTSKEIFYKMYPHIDFTRKQVQVILLKKLPTQK